MNRTRAVQFPGRPWCALWHGWSSATPERVIGVAGTLARNSLTTAGTDWWPTMAPDLQVRRPGENMLETARDAAAGVGRRNRAIDLPLLRRIRDALARLPDSALNRHYFEIPGDFLAPRADASGRDDYSIEGRYFEKVIARDAIGHGKQRSRPARPGRLPP